MDSEVFFIQSSEVEGSNGHVPEAVVDCFKTDGFLGKDVADIDLVGVPSNPAVVADEPCFVVGAGPRGVGGGGGNG